MGVGTVQKFRPILQFGDFCSIKSPGGFLFFNHFEGEGRLIIERGVLDQEDKYLKLSQCWQPFDV